MVPPWAVGECPQPALGKGQLRQNLSFTLQTETSFETASQKRLRWPWPCNRRKVPSEREESSLPALPSFPLSCLPANCSPPVLGWNCGGQAVSPAYHTVSQASPSRGRRLLYNQQADHRRPSTQNVLPDVPHPSAPLSSPGQVSLVPWASLEDNPLQKHSCLHLRGLTITFQTHLSSSYCIPGLQET